MQSECVRVHNERWWFNSQRGPLLEGQLRHWSMQILHHLSLHRPELLCSLLGSRPCQLRHHPSTSLLPVTFPLQPSSPAPFPPVSNSDLSTCCTTFNEKILPRTPDEKEKTRRSLSEPEIIFQYCHQWSERGFMTTEMWNSSYWDCKCTYLHIIPL